MWYLIMSGETYQMIKLHASVEKNSSGENPKSGSFLPRMDSCHSSWPSINTLDSYCMFVFKFFSWEFLESFIITVKQALQNSMHVDNILN